MPQGLARGVGCKFVRQADGERQRDGRIASDESGSNRSGQCIAIKGFTVEQDEQIEIVLQSTVGHAQQGNGMQLLRNDGVYRVSSQPWGRQIFEDDREDCNNWAGGDCVTEPDIDLRPAPRPGNVARDQDSGAGISGILSNLIYGNRCRIKGNAVVDLDTCDITERLGYGFQIARTKSQQVCVSWNILEVAVAEIVYKNGDSLLNEIFLM